MMLKQVLPSLKFPGKAADSTPWPVSNLGLINPVKQDDKCCRCRGLRATSQSLLHSGARPARDLVKQCRQNGHGDTAGSGNGTDSFSQQGLTGAPGEPNSVAGCTWEPAGCTCRLTEPPLLQAIACSSYCPVSHCGPTAARRNSPNRDAQ